MLQFLRSLFVTLLVITYPLLVYWAVTHGISWVVPLLISLICLQRFYRSHYQDWKFLLFALLLLLGAVFFQTLSAKAMPVVIYVSLFMLFYNSLKTEASLIERFARLDFPELPPKVPEYCRQVTWVWALFFAINALLCTALALWASDAMWALYTGVISYALLGLLMLLEYLFRHIRFPDLEIPPFKESMMNMMKNGHTIWEPKGD